MVVQKTINNLKDRPKDERKAVAGGVAIFVIVILLVAWAILFFKRIQAGTQTLNIDSGAQDEFNFTSVKQAQQAIQQSSANSNLELYQIRDESAAQHVGTQQQVYVQQIGQGTDAFGNPTSF